MKVSYNITQNKFNASLNQETTEIKVSFKTGYYPFPSDLDLSNYYTKSETYSKVEVDEIISEIPVVDTSNLVPYNGAAQDVNIGAYYFESSQGFKKTGGTSNQALTANGGVFDLNTKADLVGGKIPSSQLPSYVDDVLEFANLASFPATGESGKIYIAIDTNITYRWSGTGYAEISASLALGETASTAYRGDRGKIAFDHSQTTGNPHGTTKADIGLGNVDNTSDLDKPISTATQLALNSKQNVLTNPIIGTGTSGFHAKFNGTSTLTNSIIYDNGTSAGIGTTSPTSKLSVYSDGASIPRIGRFVQNNHGTSSIGALQAVNAASTGSAFDAGHWTSSSSDWIIRAYNNVSRAENADVSGAGSFFVFGVRADGNVGIGTTSPSEKLEVNGNVKANGFKTPTGTATQALTANGGTFDLTTKADIDDIPTKTSFTHDILVANWTLVSGKYEAVISNAGILANSFVDVIPSNDSVDIVRNAQIYPSVLISAGSVKVYSKFLPSGTISVTVNVN